VWQALHAELEPAGLTVVTVALDTDVEAARPFYAAAAATHPSLVDPALSLVERLGITNVPFGVWIDEHGTIVRPPEVAFAPRGPDADDRAQQQARLLEQLSPEQRRVIEGMTRSSADTDTGRYVDALHDWVARGADSRFVLAPEEVVARSRPRPPAAAEAAAEFELGQHLHRAGHKLDAVPHLQRAHALDPENWSYPREAYSLVDASMGSPYGTDLLTEVGQVGVDTFYPPLDI
jgi:hypothetical protein